MPVSLTWGCFRTNAGVRDVCLGIPGLVVEVLEKNRAIIEVQGIKRTVGVELVGDVKPGDYLMVHAGYAVEKLDLAEAEERIKLWEEFLAFESSEQVE